MSGIISWVKPGWSGTVIGGFRPKSVDRTLAELGYGPSARSTLAANLATFPADLALSDRRSESQVRAATDVMDPRDQRALISRLTTRQDAAAEVVVSLLLGSAAFLTGEPATAIVGTLMCMGNASAAVKSLISGA